ncbi:MAG: DNA/RNA nuclease SfsA [Bdellovibrio sp.]|nr:DNA/RNA nuclease SfsA [Bdellovibrio sp.]
MKFTRKLHEGIFLKRYKRFFADVEFQGQTVVAHVPNTGSMKGVNTTGMACLISESDNPERKLKFTLEMVKAPTGSWVGVNTATPNTVVRETVLRVIGTGASEKGSFAHWANFDEAKPEYKISAETRLDFMLKKKDTGKMHFIEVKNVTLGEDGVAKFPDAVTERGQKHLRELMALMDEGHTAELLFTVQRSDCTSFTAADDIDPEYGRLLREAQKKGMMISPHIIDLSPTEVTLSETKLKVEL